jgi:pyruvate dehydrogenase E1 component beta subunit
MMESTAFDFLDAPMQRVTGFDLPTPYAFNIEKLAFPTKDNIFNVERDVCYGIKK